VRPALPVLRQQYRGVTPALSVSSELVRGRPPQPHASRHRPFGTPEGGEELSYHATLPLTSITKTELRQHALTRLLRHTQRAPEVLERREQR
jgi:hypothetical protein